MYESLRGRLLSKDATSCVVEAGGLGYALHVPFTTAERLPGVGAEVTMKLHLVVREDEWRLFGFLGEDERALFRACLTVSGVGPSIALALLSGMRAADLRNAVAAGDVATLTRVKGIGKKTAERIVVELRDKLAAEGGGRRGAGRRSPDPWRRPSPPSRRWGSIPPRPPSGCDASRTPPSWRPGSWSSVRCGGPRASRRIPTGRRGI